MATAARVMIPTAQCSLVTAEYIAFRAIAGVVGQERIGGARVEAVHRALATLTLEHQHRSVARAKQTEYAGGMLLRIVQDHRWGLVLGRRVQAHDQAVSPGTIEEEETRSS